MLTTLVVLLGLLVVADRVAVFVVDRAVAARMQEDGDLAERPDVHVKGFPFLTQALSGHYDEVAVSIRDVTRNGLTISDLDVTVHGAELPPSKVRHASAVPVASLQATAVVTYLELAHESGLAGLTITPNGDRVKLTGKVAGVSASVTSGLTLQNDRLVVSTGGLLDFSVRIPPLPYGLQLTDAEVRPEGVVLTASSGPTVLTPQ